MSKIAYGSLYMDTGEGIDLVEPQIEAFKQHLEEIIIIGFDIIYGKGQKKEAEKTRDIIKTLLIKSFPEIPANMIGVEITDDEKKRPVRDGVVKALSLREK